jgi:hypothetical protein
MSLPVWESIIMLLMVVANYNLSVWCGHRWNSFHNKFNQNHWTEEQAQPPTYTLFMPILCKQLFQELYLVGWLRTNSLLKCDIPRNRTFLHQDIFFQKINSTVLWQQFKYGTYCCKCIFGMSNMICTDNFWYEQYDMHRQFWYEQYDMHRQFCYEQYDMHRRFLVWAIWYAQTISEPQLTAICFVKWWCMTPRKYKRMNSNY